jgi:hypothetical protein
MPNYKQTIIYSDYDAINTLNAALIIYGGIGIGKGIYLGGTLKNSYGTALLPSYTFSNDITLGIFGASNKIGFSVNAAESMNLTNTSLNVSSGIIQTNNDSTEATNENTASVVLKGGIGINKNIYMKSGSLIKAGDGSAVAPCYTFISNNTTGLYATSSLIGISMVGVNMYQFYTNEKIGIGNLTNATYNISFSGTSNRTIGIENSSTNNDGYDLSLYSGGAFSGETNLNGGSLNMFSGLSTGTGLSRTIIKRTSKGSSGTSYNTYHDGIIFPNEVNLTSGANTNLFTISVPEAGAIGLNINFSVSASNGSNLIINRTGDVTGGATNSRGTITSTFTIGTNILTRSGNPTLTLTWSLVAGTNAVTARLVANLSFASPTFFKLWYNITNGSNNSITYLL